MNGDINDRKELVQWFSKLMLEKLEARASKGGWLHESYDYHLHRLAQETMEELVPALEAKEYSDAVMEAVDVAIFAAFIADKASKE